MLFVINIEFYLIYREVFVLNILVDVLLFIFYFYFRTKLNKYKIYELDKFEQI